MDPTTGDKPADSTLNIAAWQGAAPLPLDPRGFRATGGAVEAGAASGTSVPGAPMAVRRRLGRAKRTAPTSGSRSAGSSDSGRAVWWAATLPAGRRPRGGRYGTPGRLRPANAERQRGWCWGSKGQAPRQPPCSTRRVLADAP